MKKSKQLTVKIGTAKDFMQNVKELMRAADKGHVLNPSHTLTFEVSEEMQRFLADTKINSKKTTPQ